MDKHGTNLAEVGTDLISRQALLDKFEPGLKVKDYNDGELNMLKAILYEIRFAPELSTNLAEVGTDCISRQAAIDALYSVDEYNSRSVKAIKQLPPIQPKMGRWIHDGSKWTNRWICSECGYKWFFDCIEGAYCPNCGAKMEVTE